MAEHVEYRGFTVQYTGLVNELTSSIKILPMLTANKAFQDNPVEVEALWDTGATVTCMKPMLWERLQINPFDTTGRIELAGVGGKVKTNFTIMNLLLAPNFEIEYCPVYVLDFPGDAEILIGMDIIKMGDFVICNTNNETSFSFVVPPFPDRINLAEKAEAINKNSR